MSKLNKRRCDSWIVIMFAEWFVIFTGDIVRL